jgi:hypothetical protein
MGSSEERMPHRFQCLRQDCSDARSNRSSSAQQRTVARNQRLCSNAHAAYIADRIARAVREATDRDAKV